MGAAELATHDALTAVRANHVFGLGPTANWVEGRAIKYANRLFERHVKNGTFHAGCYGEYLETFLRTLFDY